MFELIWRDTDGIEFVVEHNSLANALEHGKSINRYVTIKGSGMELVGIFGADGIDNGKLPDGTAYTWYKRRKP